MTNNLKWTKKRKLIKIRNEAALLSIPTSFQNCSRRHSWKNKAREEMKRTQRRNQIIHKDR